MDSVMKINDLDKAISTVETVKNSEGKNLVIQDENNKAI
jgi:hypothetical protein